MNNKISIEINNGHLQRQLEAIRDGLDVTIEKLKIIPETFCEKCGDELLLEERQQFDDICTKYCPRCMEKYAFHKKQGDG